jgi:signal recognition particle subunit SRP54
MFDQLTDKLTTVFEKLTNKGRLTEKDVDEALREVRLALLEADVNFRVAREFIKRIQERSIGQEVFQSLTPGQQVVKIVHDELTAILTADNHALASSEQTPTVIMLVGLQGSGKTTTAAKLAHHLDQGGHRALMVAADLRRPAAVDQLVTLGTQIGVPVYQETGSSNSVQVAKNGVAKAISLGLPFAIVDTGGRMQIDEESMAELQEVKQATAPTEVLMVVDAMTGQEAVNAATEFHHKLDLTGLILTKLDGDARGGAALSITAETSIPIKFIGTGERIENLEAFHPDRLSSRILGMGDVLSLVERVQKTFEKESTVKLEKKIREATFDLEDFLSQLQQIKRMGPISQVLEMVPGFSSIKKRMGETDLDEGRLKQTEAIIRSMTPSERQEPTIINGSRRRRISKGSGTTPQDVNQLLSQFRQMQKMMRQLSTDRGRREMMRMFR